MLRLGLQVDSARDLQLSQFEIFGRFLQGIRNIMGGAEEKETSRAIRDRLGFIAIGGADKSLHAQRRRLISFSTHTCLEGRTDSQTKPPRQ